MKHHLLEIVNSIKVGIVTGTTTTAIGLSTIESVPDEFKLFGWIPEDIGRLAALIGVLLTTALFALAVKNNRKVSLENQLLEKKLKESPPEE